jgi:hypothetical protein
MNLVQRLVRANCTIEREQTHSIHFFSAGKCMNQAKPLLPRFSAVLCGFRAGPRSYVMGERSPAKTRSSNRWPGQPKSVGRAVSQEKRIEAATALTVQ